MPGELRLNTVKDSAKQIFEYPVFPIARMEYENPLCSLFAIYCQFPKLNVAGSIPVSRSNLLRTVPPQPHYFYKTSCTFITRQVIVSSAFTSI